MPGHALVDIQDTYGCTFIGLAISILLFGITVCQTWIYFWHYSKRDRKPLQFFVLFIFFLDAVHTILCFYTVYWYVILNFGNTEALAYNMWAMNAQINFTALIEYLVQLFYARRIYVVSKSIIIPAIIVLLGTIYLVLALGKLDAFHFLPRRILISQLHIPVFIAQATALKAWSRYTSLIFSVDTSSMLWTIFYWPMSKAYANSLLAMLNSRDHIREQLSSETAANVFGLKFGLSSLRIAQGGSSTDGSGSKPTAVSISEHHSETTDFPVVRHNRDRDVESTTAEMRGSETDIPTEVHGQESELGV
ncbi:hypothetical protein V8E53_014599 [Lactarius tabidus]